MRGGRLALATSLLALVLADRGLCGGEEREEGVMEGGFPCELWRQGGTSGTYFFHFPLTGVWLRDNQNGAVVGADGVP